MNTNPNGGSGRLTLANYERLGRVRGSIEAGIEEVLRQADADPRLPRDRAVRLVLLRKGLIPWLAGIDPDTGSPRRRVARRSEISEEAAPLVDRLVEARLLSTDTDPISGEATIEPAHEALLRQWDLLQGWLKEDFALLATLDNVRRAARDWDANARDKAWLVHLGNRLAEADAINLRPHIRGMLKPYEPDYLDNCQSLDRKKMLYEVLLYRQISDYIKPYVIAEKQRLELEIENVNKSWKYRFSLDAEKNKQTISALENFIQKRGRWHPSPPKLLRTLGAWEDYLDVFVFPCCGMHVLGDQTAAMPSQLRQDGCEDVPV